MVFWAPNPWYFDPPIHGISTPLPMEYWLPYPWHIDPPTHGIATPYPPPYPWYIDPPNPWYFDPSVHGISTPLPMVYQTLSYGIMNSSLLVEMRGGFNLPWEGSKYKDKRLTPGSKYHMENWTRGQFTMGFKIPYDRCHYIPVW